MTEDPPPPTGADAPAPARKARRPRLPLFGRRRRPADTGTAPPHEPTLAVVLGGGGARGLAHVLVLEALDDLGVRPVALAGTSIGALVGCAYCSGVPARDIRLHVTRLFRDRPAVLAKLLAARVGRFVDLLASGIGNPVLVDGEALFRGFLHAGVKDTFEEMAIPFAAVATDFHARGALVMRSGAVLPAVAASAAIPGLVKPVVMDGRVLIDGAATDPVPVGAVAGRADRVLAVDVIGRPTGKPGSVPSAVEATLAAAQIMQAVIAEEKLRHAPPDLLVQPNVDFYGVLDFLQAHAIFRACEHLKDDVKRRVAALMEPAPG